MRVAVLLVGLVVALPACGGGDTTPAASPAVEKLAREIADAGVDRAIVFVSDDGSDYVATAGSKAPEADRRFRIGSVTKTLTAAIVLQLVAEEKLRLTDTLGGHVTGLPPNASKVTIRQLLNHTSGLANFTDDVGWLEQASKADSTRPIDSLRYAASQPQVFPPGSQHGYSNTNYIALGLVIEAVTGRSYGDQLSERILEPLGLDSMELATTRQLPDLDDAGENPNLPWAAGAIVSNAEDVSRFFSALLSGEVLSEDSLALMKETVPLGGAGGAGLGIFVLDQPCGRVWGHNGGIVDYLTIVGASEDGSRVVVVSVQGQPSGQLPGRADRALSQQLLDDAKNVCDRLDAGRVAGNGDPVGAGLERSKLGLTPAPRRSAGASASSRPRSRCSSPPRRAPRRARSPAPRTAPARRSGRGRPCRATASSARRRP